MDNSNQNETLDFEPELNAVKVFGDSVSLVYKNGVFSLQLGGYKINSVEDLPSLFSEIELSIAGTRIGLFLKK